MKIRAIGFDLGETLLFYRDIPLSWSSLYSPALLRVAGECGLAATPEQIDLAAAVLSRHNTRQVPRTTETHSRDILSEVLRLWELEAELHLASATESFFTFFQQDVCAYPDTIPVLNELKERGIATGILTDVPYGMPQEFVQRDLDSVGLTDLVKAVLTSVEVGFRKPDPTGQLALAERLGVSVDEVIYIGNEPKDMASARAAGITSVFLDRENCGADYGQSHTIKTLSEITAFIQQSN